MARTALAVQQVTRNSGSQLTEVAPDNVNGNVFPNDGNTELVVHNGSGGSINVTVTGVACSHGRPLSLVTAVAAGKRAVIGPFDQDQFNQKSGADLGNVYVDFSASTSVVANVRKL
jgi:hypothetical protein